MTRLSPDLIERCQRWCKVAMHDMATLRDPLVNAVSSHGSETNYPLWLRSKIAECVFALENGLDAVTAVRWARGPDSGHDVRVADVRYEVKHTVPDHRFLLWPIKKNGLFHGKQFDRLALVKVELVLASGFTVGTVSKARFDAEHYVAPNGPGWMLTVGTRYMDENDLDAFYPMENDYA